MIETKSPKNLHKLDKDKLITHKNINKYNNKNIHKYKTKKNNSRTQVGGEIHSLDDIDYNRFKLSKYINQNVDWGSCPGPPPVLDCCIL